MSRTGARRYRRERAPAEELVASGDRWIATCLDMQVNSCLSSVVVTDVFKALADPTRRAILDELAERDDQTLFELCARLATKHKVATSRQAVSQHIDVLVEAGLVVVRRESRYKFHRLDPQRLEHLTDRWLRRQQENQ